MSEQNHTPDGRKPSLRDRMKPVEFIGLAAVLALFVGIIVLFSTREPVLSIIFFGIAFIVTLVALALFALGVKPNEDERQDLAEQNHEHPELPGGADAGPRNPHD